MLFTRLYGSKNPCLHVSTRRCCMKASRLKRHGGSCSPLSTPASHFRDDNAIAISDSSGIGKQYTENLETFSRRFSFGDAVVMRQTRPCLGECGPSFLTVVVRAVGDMDRGVAQIYLVMAWHGMSCDRNCRPGETDHGVERDSLESQSQS